jgi:energy-coupling factor transporter ATP-binding protein EcfA2
MTVAGHLRLGAWLNPGWDDDLAQQRIRQLALNSKQRAGSLSGGQRAQLALTLAMAKRPELLILDEPVAALDPLARREFLQGLMETVAAHGLSVVLSSHLVADLERVCDYLVVLVASQRPVNAAGQPVSTTSAACTSVGNTGQSAGAQGNVFAPGQGPAAFVACLASHGIREAIAYQPAGRYWRFQATETAIYLALALALAGYCFRRLRRLS